MLVAAKDGVFALEQPSSSVLEFYPAWLHMLRGFYSLFGICSARALLRMAVFKSLFHQLPRFEVWKTSWWMMMFGAPTPKRCYAYSNSRVIRRLDRGYKRMKAKVKTCEKYKDRAGKVRYKGTRELRSTEQLVSS